MNLSTKERYLLEDQKSAEELCIIKYTTYANIVSDTELKSIFQQNAQKEQEHYNTIDQLLKGQVPTMSSSSSSGSSMNQSDSKQYAYATSQVNSSQSSSSQSNVQTNYGAHYGSTQFGSQNSTQNQNSTTGVGTTSFGSSDKDLCSDMLTFEKHVSATYNTAIFEFRDPQVRSVLNHIQKEEQQHGEAIFKYMEKKGWYTVK